jgi:hypothetical protein
VTETPDQPALPPLLAAARALELDRDAASSGESDDYRRGMTRAVKLLRLLNEDEPAAASSAVPAPATDRAAGVAEAIRTFPFDNFGMDDVSFALEDDPEAQEWVPALADAVLATLPATTARAVELRDYWHAEAMSATTRIIELEGQLEELRRMADETPQQPEAEHRVYAWAQTIDTADGGKTVHIPGTHHSGNGPETTAIVVDRADDPALRAMLADVETPPADDATPLLFWDESAGAVHHDGRVAVWINKAVNLAEFAPAGQLILQVQAASQLRDALGAALAEAAPAVVAQPDEEA